MLASDTTSFSTSVSYTHLPVNEWNAGNKEEAVLKVESWYSWNSLDDYENNIISIQNAYLGKRNNDYSTDATANSFSSVVKSLNPKLDELLRAQILSLIHI